MDFGLGLVLTLTDNASSGLDKASKALYTLYDVAGRLGSSFMNTGKTIISTLGQVISEVNKTGRTLMYAEKQLDALYANSGKTGAEVISQIQKYAKESMFDFENLIPAVTSLKSVGIEAFNAITSSSGEARYSLLDYASALASFAPQMKNAYGTGINAAIGAMREYIAEGNALSLKRGAGLDITGILGENKGATIEERTRQVADLIEQLNMMSMVDAMKNDPTVKLSNMGDVLFQLKGMISDSDIGGLSKSMNELIDVFYNFVSSIEESRLETIARNIGSALSSIMSPVLALSKKLVTMAEGFVNLVETNPALVKFITIGSALVGALLVLAGIALKVTSAFSGVSLMLLAMGKSFGSIGSIVKLGVLKMMSVLLPLIATIGIMKFIWKNDIAGIKTNTVSFADKLGTAFKAVNGSLSNFGRTLYDLREKGDNFTIGVMKIMTFAKALADVWGDYELSEENYTKAKSLGILPLIEAILDLKYRFKNFASGFVEGWKQIGEQIEKAVTSLLDKVKGTFLEDMLNSLTEFLQKLSSGDVQTWYDFGQAFSVLTAFAIGFYGAVKLIYGVSSVFTFIFNVVTKLLPVFNFLWGLITTVGGAFLKFGGIILKFGGWILTAIGALVGLPAWAVGLIVTALVAVVALVIKYRDEIFDALKSVGTWFYNNVISPVGNFLSELWDNIVTKFTSIGKAVGDAIKNTVTSAVNGVLSWAVGKINGFISAINFAIGIINAIPGVSISKLTPLAVPQLAQGGVVDKPTLSLIGEAGREAVVPLENNTGWVGKVANMIATEMSGLRHTSSGSYLTTNNTTTKTIQGSTDNSVVIQQGAIQINVQSATDEEAQRLAKKIMDYIKRQQELNRMVNYA